ARPSTLPVACDRVDASRGAFALFRALRASMNLRAEGESAGSTCELPQRAQLPALSVPTSPHWVQRISGMTHPKGRSVAPRSVGSQPERGSDRQCERRNYGLSINSGPCRSGNELVFNTWVPALCSPLKGVTFAGQPARCASADELNHRPRWNV